MTIKQVISIEVEKDGKLFAFQMPVGATYGTAYDAAFEILNKVAELSQSAVKALEVKKDVGENNG